MIAQLKMLVFDSLFFQLNAIVLVAGIIYFLFR